jgi:hypothetical protein
MGMCMGTRRAFSSSTLCCCSSRSFCSLLFFLAFSFFAPLVIEKKLKNKVVCVNVRQKRGRYEEPVPLYAEDGGMGGRSEKKAGEIRSQ